MRYVALYCLLACCLMGFIDPDKDGPMGALTAGLDGPFVGSASDTSVVYIFSASASDETAPVPYSVFNAMGVTGDGGLEDPDKITYYRSLNGDNDDEYYKAVSVSTADSLDCDRSDVYYRLPLISIGGAAESSGSRRHVNMWFGYDDIIPEKMRVIKASLMFVMESGSNDLGLGWMAALDTTSGRSHWLMQMLMRYL